ncbi:hypothetical protein ScPMuIL_004559 [Solemya velum]
MFSYPSEYIYLQALLAGDGINADASNCTDGYCGREFMAFVSAEIFSQINKINKVPVDNGWSEKNKSRDRPTQLVMETGLSMHIWTLFTSGESNGGFACVYGELGGHFCSPLVCDLWPLIPECYLSSELSDGCDGIMCCGGTNNRTANEYIDGPSYTIGVSVAILSVSMLASLATARYLKKRHSRRRVSNDGTSEASTRSREIL